jgi:hypothetical protein
MVNLHVGRLDSTLPKFFFNCFPNLTLPYRFEEFPLPVDEDPICNPVLSSDALFAKADRERHFPEIRIDELSRQYTGSLNGKNSI